MARHLPFPTSGTCFFWHSVFAPGALSLSNASQALHLELPKQMRGSRTARSVYMFQLNPSCSSPPTISLTRAS
ncbi:hypothetical protein CBOM_07788 [Ceraceosorus bombacis]|uniref:Uncharacterized protein n=1 Tax=Ceraceosorus bombacis TaxID=401625 RepID=A0A0N7LAX2_9BASI|nr:hypothetical protein CBOM_07788 [Ceraceosorus bombacis]